MSAALTLGGLYIGAAQGPENTVNSDGFSLSH